MLLPVFSSSIFYGLFIVRGVYILYVCFITRYSHNHINLDSCDILIIVIVVDCCDNDSIQSYYCDISMLCQKHE